jgi:GNAT superfamily N-acetyltransferase
MHFRDATPADITAMHTVRMAVLENVLSSPDKVKPEDYRIFLEEKGRGWVCQDKTKVVGFAIVDMEKCNVWALFVDPDYEGRGIGRRLLSLLTSYAFAQGCSRLWLGTQPDSRAKAFYMKAGWRPCGLTSSGDIRFELEAAHRQPEAAE